MKIEKDLDNLESYRNLSITVIRGLTDALITKVSKIYDENSKGSSISHLLDFNRVRCYIGKEIKIWELLRNILKNKEKF